jgi:hypothetical protein
VHIDLRHELLDDAGEVSGGVVDPRGAGASVPRQIDRDQLHPIPINALKDSSEHVELRSQCVQKQHRPARTRSQVSQLSSRDGHLTARGSQVVGQRPSRR